VGVPDVGAGDGVPGATVTSIDIVGSAVSVVPFALQAVRIGLPGAAFAAVSGEQIGDTEATAFALFAASAGPLRDLSSAVVHFSSRPLLPKP
jgi:hypothetical protein